MLTKTQAREQVRELLLKMAPVHAVDWDIYDETVDKPYGWVFFYNHRRYIRKGHFRSQLAGNGPILVEKETGEVHQFGTAAELEFYLQPFDKSYRQRTPKEEVL